jgi:hypothetical protein
VLELPATARNNDTIIQLSGGRFPLFLFLVRTAFSIQTVCLFFPRGIQLRWWRLVRYDLDERCIQPRRNQHRLCIKMQLNNATN